MRTNWSNVVSNALIDPRVTHIAILSDRRVITHYLYKAYLHTISDRADLTIYDNQRMIVSNREVYLQKQFSFKYYSQYFEKDAFLDQCSRMEFDNLTPRAFNCILSCELIRRIHNQFGTFFDGYCPDINFMIRISALTNIKIGLYDAPGQATNARFTLSSTGMAQSTRAPNYSDITFRKESKSYPEGLDSFLTADMAKELITVYGESKGSRLLDYKSLIEHCIYQLNVPLELEHFAIRKQQILDWLRSDGLRYFDENELSQLFYMIDKTVHIPISVVYNEKAICLTMPILYYRLTKKP
jgi:hypothetical protein